MCFYAGISFTDKIFLDNESSSLVPVFVVVVVTVVVVLHEFKLFCSMVAA